MLKRSRMLSRRWRLRFVVVLLAAACGPLLVAQEQDTDDHVVTEIQGLLKSQQSAWNLADLETFMQGYLRSENTLFVSGDELTRGWQTVFDRYKAKYTSAEKMGKLTFSDVDITRLGPETAMAAGRWELNRSNDKPHGRFTLIFRHTADGWKIVYDHTSSS